MVQEKIDEKTQTNFIYNWDDISYNFFKGGK